MQSFGFSEDFLEVQQNARVALGQLAEEAKWARSVETGTPACPAGTLDPQCLSLQIPADNPLREPPEAYRVSFRWNAATRQLERVAEGEDLAALADYVTAMTFTYLDNAGQATLDPTRVVRIVADLKLKRRTAALAQEVNVGSDIFLRNAMPVPAPPGPPTATPPRTPPPTSTRPPENITPTPPRTPTPVPSRTPRRTRTPRPTGTPRPQPTPTPTVRPR